MDSGRRTAAGLVIRRIVMRVRRRVAVMGTMNMLQRRVGAFIAERHAEVGANYGHGLACHRQAEDRHQ